MKTRTEAVRWFFLHASNAKNEARGGGGGGGGLSDPRWSLRGCGPSRGR